jgi:hypothetical protein
MIHLKLKTLFQLMHEAYEKGKKDHGENITVYMNGIDKILMEIIEDKIEVKEI